MIRLLGVVCCFVLFVGSVFAQSKAVTIEADNAMVDKGKQITTYEGKVIVNQDGLRMTGDKLVVYMREKKVNRMIMTGRRATFKQVVPDKPPIDAVAHSIRYDVPVDEILLTDNVEVKQGDNVYLGNFVRIERKYNIVSSVPREGSGNNTGEPKSTGRVKMTIQPDDYE